MARPLSCRIFLERTFSAARIANRHCAVGFIVINGASHHRPQFGKIRRTENGHARNGAQKRNVKRTVMGRTVCTDNASAINGKDCRDIRCDCNVMNELIVGTLQKSRIQRTHRSQSLFCHTSSHGDCMFLRDTYIEEPLRKFSGKARQTGT